MYTVDEILKGNLLIWISSIPFYIFFGAGSLQYHVSRYSIPEAKLHQYLHSQKFPFSIYRIDILHLLRFSSYRDAALDIGILQMILCLAIAFMAVVGSLAALVNSPGWTQFLITLMAIALHIVSILVTWRFGSKISRMREADDTP